MNGCYFESVLASIRLLLHYFVPKFSSRSQLEVGIRLSIFESQSYRDSYPKVVRPNFGLRGFLFALFAVALSFLQFSEVLQYNTMSGNYCS